MRKSRWPQCPRCGRRRRPVALGRQKECSSATGCTSCVPTYRVSSCSNCDLSSYRRNNHGPGGKDEDDPSFENAARLYEDLPAELELGGSMEDF